MAITAKEAMLNRIRAGVTHLSRGDDPIQDNTLGWPYGRPTVMPDLVGRFVERVEDYRARVVRCDEGDLAGRLAEAATDLRLATAVVPSDLPAAWVAALASAQIAVSGDEPRLSHSELDAIHAVVTAARVGIAETGTIVLDHTGDQGRRALTLVPDVHFCVVRADQIVSDVPEAVVALGPSVAARRPLTWISGPSATSDIELDRVEGVHGPRTLVVFVTG